MPCSWHCWRPSWFHMPGGLFLLVILGYGTMLMLHIPVAERVFKPYLID